MAKHPEAEAWDEFIITHDHLLDVTTLGTEKPRGYLKNRLHRAFEAGVRAGERLYGAQPADAKEK